VGSSRSDWVDGRDCNDRVDRDTGKDAEGKRRGYHHPTGTHEGIMQRLSKRSSRKKRQAERERDASYYGSTSESGGRAQGVSGQPRDILSHKREKKEKAGGERREKRKPEAAVLSVRFEVKDPGRETIW